VSHGFHNYQQEFVMGMSIGSAGSVGASQSPAVANWQQRQQDFKNLASALQTGDLGAAQKAFSGLTGGSNTISGNSPLAQLGQALQNGDLSGAQQAMQALQASRSGHHHHHHGGQETAGAASTASSSTPVTTSSGPGSLINITS
jgi:hypothetical protein